MIRNNKLQKTIGKWLSIYTLLLFVILPIFELINGFEDFSKVDIIELQENLEAELEDISDKNELSEKEYKILQTFQTLNEKSIKSSIYISIHLYSNYNSEVQVPPPEFKV